MYSKMEFWINVEMSTPPRFFRFPKTDAKLENVQNAEADYTRIYLS